VTRCLHIPTLDNELVDEGLETGAGVSVWHDGREVDEPIATRLKAYRVHGKERTTLRQMLTRRAGRPGDTRRCSGHGPDELPCVAAVGVRGHQPLHDGEFDGAVLLASHR